MGTAPSLRVRFAPSPTGYLHVGGARTALFNWLVARGAGGTFVLRIEDTDTERNRDEWVAGLQSALRWLGLDWDEGPWFQSQRSDLYDAGVQKLLAGGVAYYCDCTAEQVQARAKERGGKPGYDGFCRDRELGPGPGRAIRFRTRDDGETAFDDLIRGHVVFANRELEDFVVVRSNGTPTFLLANAVDDADMAITHIIRGEEHVNGTPKVLLLREALGVDGPPPVFAHLPLLVNEKRQKLSKRRDDVAVEDYRDRGYLPDALTNYLATLGWGPPDGVEIRPLQEIVDLFRLEDVTKSSAFFDVKKLDSFNGEYIRALPQATFVRLATPWLTLDAPWPPERYDPALFEAIAPLVQERVTVLGDVPNLVDFFFLDEPAVDDAAWDKAMKPPAGEILADVVASYFDADWKAAELHERLREIGERHGLKLNKAQAPVRVAITGRSVGPPLFESLEVLGRERTLARLEAARRRLG